MTSPTLPVTAAADEVPAAAGESAPIDARVAEEPPSPDVSLAVEDAPPPAPAPVETPRERSRAVSPRPAPRSREEREVSAVERCFTLFKAKRFAEVVTLGEEALRALRSAAVSVPTPAAAEETARLWGVVGLAKQGLGDLEGARFAFEEAIALGPRTERPTWERSLAALALTAGRQSLIGAVEGGQARRERVDSLRSAIEWLERGLAVTPGDAAMREALGSAREALWPAYEAIVKALVQRQEFVEARRLLDEVMADPDCPPARQSAFRALLGDAMGGEVGQATAEAVRHMQGGREDEAVAALARAESVMAVIAADALPAKRLQELARRLWWGYMKLGANRVEAGAVEAALGPLFNALSLTEVEAERRDETRAALVQALGAVVEAKSAEIGRLIDAGEHGAASVERDKLWSLLRGAVDQGLREDDLSDASAKARALDHRIGDQRR